MEKTIAFFGLGAMGGPMAENLLKAGCPVHTAIHRTSAEAERLAKIYGLKVFASPGDAGRDADIIITILPADSEVKSFLMNADLADALKGDAIVIDMSSCTSQAICQVEEYYASRGIPVIDAPVSGGVSGAVNGTLTIFASGSKDAQKAIRPVLDVMGTKVYDLGACGTGKAFKNINNLLSMYNVMGIAEAYRIADKNGMDKELLFNVISDSSGASSSLTSRWGRMVKGDFAGGFQLGLARKDVANAIALGEGLPLPMSHLLHELMQACAPLDTLDASALCKLFSSSSVQ